MKCRENVSNFPCVALLETLWEQNQVGKESPLVLFGLVRNSLGSPPRALARLWVESNRRMKPDVSAQRKVQVILTC